DEADVRAAQELADLVQLVAPAEEGCLRGREMAPRAELGRLDTERRVLAEDRLLQFPELGSGLQAQLIAQCPADPLEGGERVRLPSAPVEREHELPVEALAQRVIGDERLQLRYELEVPCEREIGIDPLLERDQTQLLQPGDIALRERLVGHVRKRCPSPEAER